MNPEQNKRDSSVKKLLTRSLTGLVFTVLVIFSVISTSTVLFNVFLFFTCIALYEYRSILKQGMIDVSFWFYIASLAVYFFISFGLLAFSWQTVMLIVICVMLSIPIISLFRKREFVYREVAFALLGIIWIAVPFALVNVFSGLIGGKGGQYLLLAFFISVWANDTFAYCVGSIIGRHTFFERISPKKTWEGTLGGAVLTLILAYFYSNFFPSVNFGKKEWMGFAAVIIVFGSLGDLVESMFKRQTGVKDSGSILPGHGGILDRFDSTIMSIPFVLMYLEFILK